MKTFIYGIVAYLHYYCNRYEIAVINFFEWVGFLILLYFVNAAIMLFTQSLVS